MFKKVYSFDDVLLVPKYSDIISRKEIDISRQLSRDYLLNLPIISSPMSTITEDTMANKIGDCGGLGIIHRYNSIEEQCEIVRRIHGDKKSAAIGISGDYKERCDALVEAGTNIVCIDVAHGDHIGVLNTINYIKEKYPKVVTIAGNVATAEAYERLCHAGVDLVRTSVGSGSICTTRIQTGHGIPTLQAILDCNEKRKSILSKDKNSHVSKIIADGGIKNAGDIAKSIAAGADFVMLGSMFSGTFETPGNIIEKNNKKYKEYNGMASKKAQSDWKGSYSSVEGVASHVAYKGNVSCVIEEIINNLKSAMSYSGARNIDEFMYKATFVEQTPSGNAEGKPHIFSKE